MTLVLYTSRCDGIIGGPTSEGPPVLRDSEPPTNRLTPCLGPRRPESLGGLDTSRVRPITRFCLFLYKLQSFWRVPFQHYRSKVNPMTGFREIFFSSSVRTGREVG